MTRRSGTIYAFVVLSVAPIAIGCYSGKQEFTLNGTVSYQGKPLTAGMVRLYMAENRVAMATIRADGTFEATGVFPGEAAVTIEEDMAEKSRRMIAGAKSPARPTSDSSQAGPLPQPVPLPAKYKDASTSGLTFTLKAGDPLHIELN